MSRFIIGDTGLKAFSDAELLNLLTNPDAFFSDGRNIEKLIGLNKTTKARLADVLSKNQLPKDQLMPRLKNALELAAKYSQAKLK